MLVGKKKSFQRLYKKIYLLTPIYFTNSATIF